jgi:hypothetical protein
MNLVATANVNFEVKLELELGIEGELKLGGRSKAEQNHAERQGSESKLPC